MRLGLIVLNMIIWLAILKHIGIAIKIWSLCSPIEKGKVFFVALIYLLGAILVTLISLFIGMSL